MQEVLVSIRGLGFRYPGAAVPVFESVGFDIRASEIFGVFGPNGVGKSTLIRAIAGLQSGSGEVVFHAQRQGRLSVGYTPQDYRASFFPWASVEWNVRLGLGADFRNPEAKRKVAEVAEALGVSLNFRKRPHHFSGGMLQQAALVRALVGAAPLIVADEPFSSLDVEVAARVRQGLRQWIRTTRSAAIIVTHDIESLCDICDRVLIVSDRQFSLSEADGAFRGCEIAVNEHGAKGVEESRAKAGVLLKRLLSNGGTKP